MNNDKSNHPAAWLPRGTYGIMVHYLLSPNGNTPAERTTKLNQIIDTFDLDFFLNQFTKSRADWLIFTLGQNTGYYNSPNPFLDQLLPGRTPRRDLVLEIARRITAKGKRFIAYLPAEVGGQASDIKTAFAWNPPDQTEFLNRYLHFVADYSRTLGRQCSGWWFDGCYDHIHNGRWDWQTWIAAARTGNPDSIVAFNDGAFCVGREKPVTPLQHYHAGEVHLLEEGKIRFDFLGENQEVTADGKLRTKGTDPKFYMPTSQFVQGVQWHALVPLDLSFNSRIPDEYCCYPDAGLQKFLQTCKAVGGAVTFNVPIDDQGHIPPPSAEKLQKLGENFRP
jgi:hypothetical protein